MVTIEQEIWEYVQKVKAASNEECQKQYLSLWESGEAPTFSITGGRRFYKVETIHKYQTSVFCFIEKSTGDLYKAATWKQPAKGVRGNIRDEKVPLTLLEFYIRH